MKKRKKILLACWLLAAWTLTPSTVFGQKIEREQRIPAREMPAEAIDYLNHHFSSYDRIRYYEDISEYGRFLEAKFRYRDQRYSIEFFPDGRWKDTERQIRFQDLPTQAADSIRQSLDRYFRHYRIVKTQEQLIDGKVTGYELELKGKSDDYLGFFEGQFDAAGREVSIRTVEKRDNEFLFF